MIDLQLENKIKNLAKSKKIPLSELYEKIEMTGQGFNIALKNNTLKIETLLKICEVLEVDISYFFETSEVENNSFKRNDNNRKEANFLSKNPNIELLQKIKDLENEITLLKNFLTFHNFYFSILWTELGLIHRNNYKENKKFVVNSVYRINNNICKIFTNKDVLKQLAEQSPFKEFELDVIEAFEQKKTKDEIFKIIETGLDEIYTEEKIKM